MARTPKKNATRFIYTIEQETHQFLKNEGEVQATNMTRQRKKENKFVRQRTRDSRFKLISNILCLLS